MIFLLSQFINTFVAKFQKRPMFFSTVVAFGGFVVLGWLAGTMEPNYSFDTDAYQAAYSWSPESKRFESGYMILTYFFYLHGWSYEHFRLLSGLIVFILFFIAVKRFTKNISAFYSLFAIFPFVNEATQVRNFMMYTLVLLGASFLQKKSVKNYFIATILIYLSSTFQISGLIYLIIIPLSLLSFNFIKKLTSITVIFMTAFSFVLLFGGASINRVVMNLFLTLSSRSDTDALVAAGSTSTSRVLPIAMILAFLFAYLYNEFLVRNISRSISVSLKEVSWERQQIIIYSIIIIGSIGIPLIIGSYNFERIIRNSLTIIILNYAICQQYRNNLSRNFRIYLFTGIIGVILLGTIAKGYWLTGDFRIGQYIPYILHLKDKGGF